MVKEIVLQPWYKVATPREDLREGKPLDASQFAIHLDQVVDGRAPIDYQDPAQFFSKTHLTGGLLELTAEVTRRLSGETIGASAVIILTTQFGGGKTHALTALYHLAKCGPSAKKFSGVKDILQKAKVSSIPDAAVAVFVGSEFDYITGKGIKGEPIRKTPWGDIAWQLQGREGFTIVQEHDAKKSPPGKEVIRKILPKDKPVLILMDEVLNFMTRARAERVGRSTFAAQFYEFLQGLSEEASGRPGVCVILSLPKSEQEMTAEDEADFGRLQKLATRVGKPYVLAEGLEIAEIIRKRLFEDLGPADLLVERCDCADYVAAVVEEELEFTWLLLQALVQKALLVLGFYAVDVSELHLERDSEVVVEASKGVPVRDGEGLTVLVL